MLFFYTKTKNQPTGDGGVILQINAPSNLYFINTNGPAIGPRVGQSRRNQESHEPPTSMQSPVGARPTDLQNTAEAATVDTPGPEASPQSVDAHAEVVDRRPSLRGILYRISAVFRRRRSARLETNL
ncbi:hypothetical protein FA15DRAFT_675158 [Coprinopsis marcescibilis]|uniref:Uncharacterized protein n=1 Tax=Coprinopsis marcescibilis TaxID=230819 RepID=A0A5C3KET7_COPMA|nr:hypothetical protein FA15DRAFT_675158 [Coprinopsis marcescibilis]